MRIPGEIFRRALAAGAMVAISPVSLGCMGVIFALDGRPLFFTQTRLGRHRKPFTLYKFRTMRNETITRPGHWLRKTGLDELPQLIHVLCGEMNWIGPRPLSVTDHERLSADYPALDDRYAVRPGITGILQILGTRGAAFSIRVENEYARRKNLFTDLQIAALTTLALVLGKHGVRRLVAAFPAWKSTLLYE